MAELREELREGINDYRIQKRTLIQDRLRQLDSNVATINTEDEMIKAAKLLDQKSQVTPELLISITNGLLKNQNYIEAFLKVDSALPALVKYFSCEETVLYRIYWNSTYSAVPPVFLGSRRLSPYTRPKEQDKTDWDRRPLFHVLILPKLDARLQLLAGHCLCNLAMGEDRQILRVCKAACASLVMRINGMNSLITEASIWALGNMSTCKQAAKILHSQGAYTHVASLLASTSDEDVRSACFYCLIHAIFNNRHLFKSEEYVECANVCLTVPMVDPLHFLLCSILSYSTDVRQKMAVFNIHNQALTRLVQILQSTIEPKETTTIFSCIRILGNMVHEKSVAIQVLQSPNLASVMTQLLAQPEAPLMKDVVWLMANLIYHNDHEVSVICDEIGIRGWFPVNFNCSLQPISHPGS